MAVTRSVSGVPGLDDILHGGFPSGRVFLVEGEPGSGKTTLAVQFLLAGRDQGERVLYLALSESASELQAVAESHEFDLTGVEVREVLDLDAEFMPRSASTIFQPTEFELGETVQSMMQAIDEVGPARVVIDSLSELRLLAQSPLRYRQQIFAIKKFLSEKTCTVLLLDDANQNAREMDLHSVVHGVLSLEQSAPLYGAERRQIRITKLRGSSYRGGNHDFRIEMGGIRVFPRLVAAETRGTVHKELLPSGLPELDALLGGGLDRGTSTLLMGPAGSGKSTVALQYVLAAASRGERSAMFLFDESPETLRARAAGLGMPLEEALDAGLVALRRIDPAELSPGEFSHLIRMAVSPDGGRASVLVLDSLNGYLQAMPEERYLTLHLHELLAFLGQHGVAVILVVAQQGLIGPLQSPVDASYLADTVLLFGYVETNGYIGQTIAAIKKRSGPHERSVREMTMGQRGLQIGGIVPRPRDDAAGIPSGTARDPSDVR